MDDDFYFWDMYMWMLIQLIEMLDQNEKFLCFSLDGYFIVYQVGNVDGFVWSLCWVVFDGLYNVEIVMVGNLVINLDMFLNGEWIVFVGWVFEDVICNDIFIVCLDGFDLINLMGEVDVIGYFVLLFWFLDGQIIVFFGGDIDVDMVEIFLVDVYSWDVWVFMEIEIYKEMGLIYLLDGCYLVVFVGFQNYDFYWLVVIDLEIGMVCQLDVLFEYYVCFVWSVDSNLFYYQEIVQGGVCIVCYDFVEDEIYNFGIFGGWEEELMYWVVVVYCGVYEGGY